MSAGCNLPCCIEERPCPICGDPVDNPRRDWQPSAPALMCEACNAGPRCDRCGDPEPGGVALYDSENTLCEHCAWLATEAERKAAQREWELRDAYADEMRDRIKGERRPVDARIRAYVGGALDGQRRTH